MTMINFKDNKQFDQWQQTWSWFQNQASPWHDEWYFSTIWNFFLERTVL